MSFFRIKELFSCWVFIMTSFSLQVDCLGHQDPMEDLFSLAAIYSPEDSPIWYDKRNLNIDGLSEIMSKMLSKLVADYNESAKKLQNDASYSKWNGK